MIDPAPADGYARDGGRGVSPRERRRRSRGAVIARRMFWSLLLLCLFGAAVAIAVSVLTTAANNEIVHYRQVIANDAQHAITQVQRIINHYTK